MNITKEKCNEVVGKNIRQIRESMDINPDDFAYLGMSDT